MAIAGSRSQSDASFSAVYELGGRDLVFGKVPNFRYESKLGGIDGSRKQVLVLSG
jgi:hypothetical protein